MSTRNHARRAASVWLRWLWATLFVVVAGNVSAAKLELVLSEETGAYAEVAAALRQELGSGPTISEVNVAALERSAASDTSVVVVLGTRALTAVLPTRNVAIIAALVPRDAFDIALQEARKSRDVKAVTAIYLDQPYLRQLDLVRAVLPGRSRVGILSSPDMRENLGLLRAAAKSRKLSLVEESVTAAQQIYPALTKVLGSADLILAMPDPMLFNNGTIHNILLAAYRDEHPLFGFSPAYVRAGALAAVYSTPKQIAHQIADTVKLALGGSPLPVPEYPQTFTVGVNRTVARSLGLTVEDSAALEAKLQAMEKEP